MVKFVCDNKALESALRKLHRLVVDHGGLVYDGLTISSKNGDLTITVDDKKPKGKKIIILPKECLLPAEKYDLVLDGDKIVMNNFDKELPAHKVEMMQAMIKIYNLTDKIKSHKKTSTLALYYTDRPLFDMLLKTFGKGGIPYLNKMEVLDLDHFYLESFIKTRVLGYDEKDTEGDSVASTKGGKITPVLMPIIDFINHYPTVPGFFTAFGKDDSPDEKDEVQNPHKEGIAVVKSCPFEDSDETYVSYGTYEAMDTFLHYNYVEHHAPYVRSVPMQVKIGEECALNIMAGARIGKHKKLPMKVRDLKFFIPFIRVDRDKKIAIVSTLLIPQETAPRALRRVLGFVFSQMGLGWDEDKIIDAVCEAERQIIQENLRRYTAFDAYLKTYKPKESTKIVFANAKEMVAVQQEKIKKYPFFAQAIQSGPPARINKKTA